MNVLNMNLSIPVLLLLAMTAVVYFRHRVNPGDFSNTGNYANISPLKHDLVKQLTLDMIPLMVYGLNADGPFWNPSNPLGSKVGVMGVTLIAYVVYYHLVEPMSNKVMNV